VPTAEVRNRPDLHIEALGLRLRLFSLSFAPRHPLFGLGYGGRVGEAPIIPSTIFRPFTRFIDRISITASPSANLGRAVLRLADASPAFEFTDFTETVIKYGESVRNSPMTCARYQKMNVSYRDKALQPPPIPHSP